MTKAASAILVLALACLFALSTALPSMLDRTVSAQTGSDLPRTLLGKPYRTRSDSQGCPPNHWPPAVIDRNDSDTDVDVDPGPDPADLDLNHEFARQARIGSGGRTQTIERAKTKSCVPLPLPLVLNTIPEPGSVPSRLTRSKRPLRYSPCSEALPLSSHAQSDAMIPSIENVQHVESHVESSPKGMTGLRKPPVPVRRLKRLYDRGERKSRLFEEY